MGRGRKTIGGILAAAAAAITARATVARSPEPPPPPPGRPDRYGWRHADIFHTTRGNGAPALLLHDLYTGASGLEMAPLGDRLEEHFTVYTVDLPGFGRSGRPSMRYGPDFFFDAIVEFVRHVVDRPTLVVGCGLSAAYAIEAAVRLGNLVSGVVMLAPPEAEGPELLEAPTWRPLVYQGLRSPFGAAYHWWHASPAWRKASLRGALRVEPSDLEARAEQLSRSARQPGGRWALWSLWSGDLAWDARPALARLGAPTLVLWGSEARANPLAPEHYHAVRPDITQQVVPGTARWPHVDTPDTVAAEIQRWWAAEGPGSIP